MKPNKSNYPETLDGNSNLYQVEDALKVHLGLDYYPGNTSIMADSDVSNFPPYGIIHFGRSV